MDTVFQENYFNDKALNGGDEYISACALMLAAMASGQSRLHNFSPNLALANLLGYLIHTGVRIEKNENTLVVYGNGLKTFRASSLKNTPTKVYDLISVLAYKEEIRNFDDVAVKAFIDGYSAKIKKAVAFAKVKHKKDILYSLSQKDYASRSAEEYFYLKAALLFSALFEDKKVVIRESFPSCDHLERFFSYFDIKLESWGKHENRITVLPPDKPFLAHDITMPNAFLNIALPVLQTIFSQSGVFEAKYILLNPKRSGFLYILKAMGADIQITNRSWFGFEPVADIMVHGGKVLTGVVVPEAISAAMFGELPFLLAAAAYIEGKTTFYGMGDNAKTEKMRSVVTNCFELPEPLQISAAGVLEVQGSCDMVLAEKYWHNL